MQVRCSLVSLLPLLSKSSKLYSKYCWAFWSSNCKILHNLAPNYSIINQYSFCVQLFCSTILGIWGLKFMGEFCCMLFKLCGFGQRKPNNIIDSQIPQGSDGSNETRQNYQEPDVGPLLISYVCYYSLNFFPQHLKDLLLWFNTSREELSITVKSEVEVPLL